jgi:DNA-binding response OmpR family regulator
MALSALSALVAQHGFAKMEEVFQLLREREELQARIAAALSQEQEQAADPMEPALVPVEVLGSGPRPRRRLSAETSFELASEEDIQSITQQINEGRLRSEKKGLNWNEGARHHPSSERQQEIIAVLRAQEGRSATREQLMQKLSGKWTWAYQTGHSPAGEFIGELVKQGIVVRHN